MHDSPFEEALQALLGPLRFASRSDGAEGDLRGRVLNLEAHLQKGAETASRLAIPEDARKTLRAISKRFAKPAEGPTLEAARKALEGLAEPSYTEEVLSASVATLPGLGKRRAELLAKRGLEHVSHLLFHLPVRYDDRRESKRISELEVGERATFEAEVVLSGEASNFRRRGRRMIEAVVGDDSGTVQLKWFRGFDSLLGMLAKGNRLRITGDVKRYRFSKELVHPEIEVLREGAGPQGADLIAEYPLIDGIPPRTLRRAIQAAVASRSDLCATYAPQPEGAPELPNVPEALRILHDPGAEEDVEALRDHSHRAHQRLVLEELFLLEVGLALRRSRQKVLPGIRVPAASERVKQAIRDLPFQLTGAQLRAFGEIESDLAGTDEAAAGPMHRLLQGDVGSGKTAVAYLAALTAAAAGMQTALMAPTELLAEQHARTLNRLAGATPGGLRLALLTASKSRAEADAVRTQLASGQIECVVGTQALLQPGVAFKNLALAIVDEQHRFGVKQRAALAAKAPGNNVPHTLVMTATPIPRTLSLTLYGDLDVSVIDELPAGRQAIQTELLRQGEGARVMASVRETLERGEQVYVVYPLVEESEAIDLRSATEQAERIQRALPDHRVALVHGRLGADERARTMAAFEAGEIAVLVSTTVVEVGVDVPNASLMVIEHAERFGLAQLHQLRGRVGRGERPGTCILIARGASEDSEARLRAMLKTTDGFEIADSDLAIRGPGEFLGTRQHGHMPELRMADLLRDGQLLAEARRAAFRTVAEDPDLARHRGLARAVSRRWGSRLALADVG